MSVVFQNLFRFLKGDSLTLGTQQRKSRSRFHDIERKIILFEILGHMLVTTSTIDFLFCDMLSSGILFFLEEQIRSPFFNESH